MSIRTLLRPTKLEGSDHVLYLDRLRGPNLHGWIHTKTPGIETNFKLEATTPTNFILASQFESAPATLHSLKGPEGCRYFVLALDDLLPLRDIYEGTIKVPNISLSLRRGSGYPIGSIAVTATREDLIKARLATNVEHKEGSIVGWHIDMHPEKSAPKITLRNSQGKEQKVGLKRADEIASLVEKASAWTISARLFPSFTVGQYPVALIVSTENNIVLSEMPVPIAPASYHIDTANGVLQGWAIDNVKPAKRPLIRVTGDGAVLRQMRAGLYRPDIRKIIPNFDGFCGFQIPLSGIDGPLRITIEASEGATQIDLDSQKKS